jgi:hypothetical protein
MAKSHPDDWAADAPAPAQLAKFSRQNQSSRIAEVTLQVRSGTPSVGEDAAHLVMGDDIIFPYDVVAARGITYTDQLLKHLADTIPSAQQLKWCKENGYAIVAGSPTPMSLLDIHSLKPSLFIAEMGGWYVEESFASDDKVKCEWLAIRKTEVLNSLNKTWDEQQILLREHEQVPNAAEMSWFITTYYEVRGVRLFPNVFVRTCSVNWEDYHVLVGFFGGYGLGVNNFREGRGRFDLGVAASRKF